MDYKNFFLRLIFSIFFIILYVVISTINFNYVPYLISVIYLLIIYEILIYFKKYRILPLIYTIISMVFFINIDFNNKNFITFNLFIFTVIIFDIFSYLIGKSFGKNKLISISPNKTIEGLVGGFSFSLLFSILNLYFFKLPINIFSILIIILIILFAFIGDILESYFKRKNILKNSSGLIPGHGGVFDRFDSFLFAIIFYSISTKYII